MAYIVVIEDDPEVLDNIKDVLEAVGYQVQGAPNGLAGLEVVRQVMPDVVLCDANMPLLDGYGVLQELRNHAETATLPFIFLTALTERSDLRRGMEMGADDFVTKPFSQAELLRAIQTRLHKQETIITQHEADIQALRNSIVYSLPHELRTPLTQIMGFADILHMSADSMTPDDIRDMAHHILKGSNRLHRLIENYLIYAQLELLSNNWAEIENLREAACDVGDQVPQTTRQCAESYGRLADATIEVSPAMVRLSAENLSRIIFELVDNAFKFSKPGSKVVIKSRLEGRSYVIGIRDYGMGMNPEQVKKLGAYMQFDRTLHEQQGIGLGFSIARRLTELHGGQLTIKSNPSSGTLIMIHLPL
jgi:K+-sensing histidine kinase KdpD